MCKHCSHMLQELTMCLCNIAYVTDLHECYDTAGTHVAPINQSAIMTWCMVEFNCAMCPRGPVSSNTQQAVARIAQAPLGKISQATSEQLATQRHCHIPGFR